MKNAIDRFDSSTFKICLQREGHTLQIASKVLRKSLKTPIPLYDQKTRLFLKLINDGDIGIAYVKDRMVCEIVHSGFVDLGITGSDRIIESGFEKKVKILKHIDQISWPLVLAIPLSSKIRKLSEIGSIATQYPKIVRKFLRSKGMTNKIKVIKVVGSTEAMPYGKWLGKKVNAIADISITGRSLKNNSLIPLGKPITIFHPTIIANKKSLKQRGKIDYFNQFYRNA